MFTAQRPSHDDDGTGLGSRLAGANLPSDASRSEYANQVSSNEQPESTGNLVPGLADLGKTMSAMRRGRGPSIRVHREWLAGLRARATASGMTQDELAAKAGLDDSAVSRLWKRLTLSDHVFSVSRDLVVALAQELTYPLPHIALATGRTPPETLPPQQQADAQAHLERYRRMRKMVAGASGMRPEQIDAIAAMIAELCSDMPPDEVAAVIRCLAEDD